jgi:hypothetical protein
MRDPALKKRAREVLPRRGWLYYCAHTVWCYRRTSTPARFREHERTLAWWSVQASPRAASGTPSAWLACRQRAKKGLMPPTYGMPRRCWMSRHSLSRLRQPRSNRRSMALAIRHRSCQGETQSDAGVLTKTSDRPPRIGRSSAGLSGSCLARNVTQLSRQLLLSHARPWLRMGHSLQTEA